MCTALSHHRSQVCHTLRPGGWKLWWKDHLTQLGRLTEMFCSRSLSQVWAPRAFLQSWEVMLQLCAPLGTTSIAAQTVLLVTGWSLSTSGAQQQAVWPTQGRHWAQVSKIHADNWSLEPAAVSGRRWAAHSVHHPPRPTPTVFDMAGPGTLHRHDLLGFVGFLPIHLASNTAWHPSLERSLTSVLVLAGSTLVCP